MITYISSGYIWSNLDKDDIKLNTPDEGRAQQQNKCPVTIFLSTYVTKIALFRGWNKKEILYVDISILNFNF